FKFYDFEITGQILDGHDANLNIIKISPKKDFSPTFTGYIYVNVNTSQVSKLSLSLGDNASISFINDLTIDQDLTKIDSVYYPIKTIITYYGKGLGFAFSGTCTGNFSYTKDLSKIGNFKNHEILKINKQTEESEKSIAKNRPVPLTT